MDADDAPAQDSVFQFVQTASRGGGERGSDEGFIGAADNLSGFIGHKDLTVLRFDREEHFLQEALVQAENDDAVELFQLFVIHDAVGQVKKPVILIGKAGSEFRGPDMGREVRGGEAVDLVAAQAETADPGVFVDGVGELVVGDDAAVLHNDHDGFDEGIGVQDGAEIAAHFADADGRVLAFIDIVRPDDHIVVGVHLIKQVFIFAEADAQDAFRGLHIDSRQLLRAAPEGDGGAVCHIGADHRDHDRGENAETADQHLPHGTFLTACFPHCPSPLQN